MPESEPLPSLESLQQKIDEATAHGQVEKQDTSSGTRSSMAQATQFVWGFVAGAGIGSVSGYFIDRWLGTSPLFLLICFVLGFAAGVYNLMRHAGNSGKK